MPNASAPTPVRACVTVTADDGHAGMRQAQFRTDDVYDSLFRRVDIKQLYAKLSAVFSERLHLCGSDCVGNR